MTSPTPLVRLAAAYGIDPLYLDVWGAQAAAPEPTLRALLAAMGVAADGDAAVAEALREVEERPRREFLPPALAVDAGARIEVPLGAPAGPASARVAWTLTDERGEALAGDAVAGRREGDGRFAFALAAPPEAGYYDLAAECGGASGSLRLIVAPERCFMPQEALGPDRAWGVAAQLYGLRSHRNWGMGDFSDLAQLCEAAAGAGADIVGVNPLHALFPADAGAYGPYRPSSRQTLNVLYVDPDAAPEMAGCPDAHALIGGIELRDRLRAVRSGPLVDYAEVWALKRPILELLFATFRSRSPEGARRAAFEAFRRERGEALRRQALFDALQERFLAEDRANWSWRNWPEAFRRADAPAVAAFAREHAERVDFHEYLQWLADEQLAGAQREARENGMRIGLFQDLAVGVHPEGAATWAFPDATPTGASVGAPPDLMNRRGQNWGLAAPSPASLRATAFAQFAADLRATMRHAGAVRIDHAFGLRRLFWIPDGAPPRDGAYVRYPFDALLRIVKLESRRNRCLVVAEDLGTLPEGFQDALAGAGALSYRVLWFEQDGEACRPAEAWPELALAAATTHDLPTVAGFWVSRDLDWRDRLDLHPDAETGGRMREERGRELARLAAALGLPPEFAGAAPDDLVLRAYRYLAGTPCRLLLATLEDVLEETEAPNLPGTVDQHPNWRRRLPLPVEEIFRHDKARRLFAALRAARPRSPA